MLPVRPIAYSGAGQNPLPPETPSSRSIAKQPVRPAARPQVDRPESAAVRRLLGTATLDDQPCHVRCCPSIGWEERVMGFLGCYAIGAALSLSSLLSFPLLIAGNPTPFAWKYSLGNCLSLVSSAFLVGPRTQCQQMSSPLRLGASVAYVASISMTVVAALILQHALLTLFAMVLQFCALGWYCASYIPFGRMCITTCISRTCCPV